MKNLLILLGPIPESVGQLFENWESIVRQDGRFNPTVQQVSRSTPPSEVMAMIHDFRPDAVQLVGSAPMFPTGFNAYDGHESRCVWGDVPYTGAFIKAKLVDEKNHKHTRTTPDSYRNVAGDGRYDNVFGGRMLWPVGRIDFSRLVEFNPSMKRPDGKVCWPAINESDALSDYFRRNFEYRIKPASRKVDAHVCGGNFTAAHMKRLQARCPRFSWFYKSTGGLLEGQDVDGFVYGSLGSRYWYKYERGGKMLSAFWHNCHSSKQYEYLHDGAGIRRSLTWALVSTWGYADAYWSPTNKDSTVADVAKSSWARYGTISLAASLCGDITLRLPDC